MKRLGKIPPVQPRGMTLVEVVMAVALLAIAISGTYTAWISSVRLQALQREESLVQAAMQRYINAMRSLPFAQVDNQIPANPNYQNGIYVPGTNDGFSGGPYDPPVPDNRLRPGFIKLFLGWTGQGNPTDAALRGVRVSPFQFANAVKYGNSWWAPDTTRPELRIIFINNEWPTEARMGETPTDLSDGVDLDGDGQISETPLPDPATAGLLEFGVVDAQRLFPRLLAVPLVNPPRDPQPGFINVTQMVVYPVVVQARWWSAAGVPRQITVITFLANRAGSSTPAVDSVVPTP